MILFLSKKNSQFPVGALLFTMTLMGASSGFASTGTSWSSQPSWAATTPDDSSTPAAHKSSYSRDSRANITPYAPGSHNIALDVGQVFLMGDLAAKYANNIGTQLHYTYGVSEIFGFDSSLGFSDHANGAYTMATLLTGLRTNLSWYDKVIPYVIVGLGFYRPSFTQAGAGPNGTPGNVAPVLFGVHLGPGVDLQLSKNLFFGTAITFHDIFGGNQGNTPAPVEDGGTFVSFYVHAGVTF